MAKIMGFIISCIAIQFIVNGITAITTYNGSPPQLAPAYGG
jgi:hypothetical protein